MRMVNASVALLDEKDPFKKIERAGRICYKSEDKITEDSAKKFVETMIRSQHYAMLEHANFVFEVKNRSYFNILQTERFLNCTKELLPSGELRMLVSGNLRAINEAENAWQLAFVLAKTYPELVYRKDITYAVDNDDVPFVKMVSLDELTHTAYPPTDMEILAHCYLTFIFTTDRGVTHEIVRHRIASFAQESTRYCCYNKEKFGGGLTIALPDDFGDKAPEVQEEYQAAWEDAERHYLKLLDMGETAQQARGVLPHHVKADIVMTANMGEWKHFFDLRYLGTTGAPHPDMRAVAKMAYDLCPQEIKNII